MKRRTAVTTAVVLIAAYAVLAGFWVSLHLPLAWIAGGGIVVVIAVYVMLRTSGRLDPFAEPGEALTDDADEHLDGLRKPGDRETEEKLTADARQRGLFLRYQNVRERKATKLAANERKRTLRRRGKHAMTRTGATSPVPVLEADSQQWRDRYVVPQEPLSSSVPVLTGTNEGRERLADTGDFRAVESVTPKDVPGAAGQPGENAGDGAGLVGHRAAPAAAFAVSHVAAPGTPAVDHEPAPEESVPELPDAEDGDPEPLYADREPFTDWLRDSVVMRAITDDAVEVSQ